MFWSCNENFFRCEKSLQTTLLSTHFNIYLNLEASLHSIITVICINPYSPNKLIATKYCFLILGDDTSFFFFFFFLLFLLFYVIVNFYKNYLIFNVFFHENYFYFFMFRDVPRCSGMFRDVPECSGMSRNVPCSWFYRRRNTLVSERSDRDLCASWYFFSPVKLTDVWGTSIKPELR